MKHILIIPLFLASLLPLSAAVFQDVNPEKANDLIQTEGSSIVILDIRTAHEFASGHIENAQNIDYYSPDFESMISKLDKNQTYLIYCRSGNRSSHAMPVFKRNSFDRVYNMTGGISQWQKKGYPLSR